MTRDYKHTRVKPDRKPVPGWVWMLTGLAIGLLVALLVYLQGQPSRPRTTPMPSSQPAPVKAEEKKKTKTMKPASEENAGLRYEFYTLLPESEVVIPDQELTQATAKPGTEASTPKAVYMLQAGSFRREQEAESLKAQLALIGIESSIEKVTVHGDTWHRLRIGPFTSVRDVNETRNRLQRNDINAILVKLRG